MLPVTEMYYIQLVVARFNIHCAWYIKTTLVAKISQHLLETCFPGSQRELGIKRNVYGGMYRMAQKMPPPLASLCCVKK